MSERPDHDEVIRSRMRLHSLEATVIGLDYRLKAVEALLKEGLPILRRLDTEGQVRAAVSLTWVQRASLFAAACGGVGSLLAVLLK